MALYVVGRNTSCYWVADTARPQESTGDMLTVLPWCIRWKQWLSTNPTPLETIEKFSPVFAMTKDERDAALSEIIEAGGVPG